MSHRQDAAPESDPLPGPAQSEAPGAAPDHVALAKTNPHPVLICRAGGQLTYGNAAAERLTRTLGLDTPAALLPADHLDIKHRCLASHTPARAEACAAGRRILWSYHPAGPDTVYLYGVDLSEAPLNAVLDQLAIGVVMIDAALSVHYANPAARSLLNDDSPLRIQHGAKGEVLSSDRTDCLTSITRMVRGLCRPDPDPESPSVLALPRTGDGGFLEILAAPAATPSLGPQLAGGLVALFILDPAQGSGLVESTLCALYSLTPTEGRIAVLLADGHPSGEIAAALSIRISTLRTHLRHLFRKTCTTGQTELVRLLVSGVARVVLPR